MTIITGYIQLIHVGNKNMIKFVLEYKSGYDTVSTFTPKKKLILKLLVHAFREIELQDFIDLADEKITGANMNDYDMDWEENNVHVSCMYYDKYIMKDEDESELVISGDNFKAIVEIWKKIRKNPTPYLVIVQDDTGWIWVQGKQELDESDLQEVEEDDKAYAEYKKNQNTI